MRSCAEPPHTLPATAPKMMFPLVLDLAADNIPFAVTCRVLGFSKQAFYRWWAGPVTQRDWDDAHLINAAIEIHHDDPGFGYRFIADELPGRGPSPAGTG
jgi:putative transposase